MQILASLLSAQNALLKEFKKKTKKTKHSLSEDDIEDDSDTEESSLSHHLAAVKLWKEDIVTRVELTKILQQYDYPLAPFLKRACAAIAKSMITLKDLKKVISPPVYDSIMNQLSLAIRDVQEEILEPGGRPQLQQNYALSQSLLGARYSPAQLKQKLIPRKKPFKDFPKDQPPPKLPWKPKQKKPWPNAAQPAQSAGDATPPEH